MSNKVIPEDVYFEIPNEELRNKVANGYLAIAITCISRYPMQLISVL